MSNQSLRTLQGWCARQCASYPGIHIKDLSTSFTNGLAFCAIIHRYRPDLIDFYTLDPSNSLENNRIAFCVAEKYLGIPALLEPEEMSMIDKPDTLSLLTYLSQYYHYFKDKIPCNESIEDIRTDSSSPPRYRLHNPHKFAMPLDRKEFLYSSSEDSGSLIQEKSFIRTPLDVIRNSRDSLRTNDDTSSDMIETPGIKQHIENIINSMHEPCVSSSVDSSVPVMTSSVEPETSTSSYYDAASTPNIYTVQDVGKIINRAYDPDNGSSKGTTCFICGSHVYILERVVAKQRLFHRQCFVCNGCGTKLLLGLYEVYDGDSMFYCRSCYKKIKLRETCKTDEYREALGCPVTDPAELWCLPSLPSAPIIEETKPRVRFDMFVEQHHQSTSASEYSTEEEEEELDSRPRSLSCGSDLELDSSQRKRRWYVRERLLSPILRRLKRSNNSSLDDIDRVLREEEELLLVKKEKYLLEMNENEHQQKQMELCGQGLEMRLRKEGDDIDENLLVDWFELVNRKNRLNHTESILVITIQEIEINLQQKALERQLRDLHGVKKKYNKSYIKKKESELIKKLLQLVEDRDNLINMEERERLTAIEMDMQFKKVISSSKF